MTGQSPSSFGDALRQARIAAGMTQEALAIRSGLGVRSIQGLEQGESQPRRETLRRLGTALQLPIDQAAEWERCTQPAPRQRRQAAPGPETTLGDWGARLAARHNFPTPLNRFIGRERESIEVKRLLRANRLLTLTGPGGCGKSRLALHVAAEMREDFAYGIWLVELAAVSNPALVPRVVARATGLQEHAGEDPARTLAEAFSLGPRLLVLDNCEHLVNACAELADLLLGACPQLRILATTRESLGINGEAIWHVPCLSLPDPYQSLSLEIVRRSEAVSLFVERAVASCPEFVLTEETAPAIVEICNRLDGLPLALELAAVRARVLGPNEIARRLDDRFRLLTGGGRTTMPHHQTLQASISWSYDLLSERERDLFDRLSVFAGGWTIEAAEAVCGEGDTGPESVLDLLAQLSTKSMVQAEPGASTRFSMLETLRQFGVTRLAERGEVESNTRSGHAAYFLRLAEQAEADQHGPRLKEWLDRLESELHNVRTALEYTWRQGSGTTAQRLANAFAFFGLVNQHRSEVRDWLERSLAITAEGGYVAVRAKGLVLTGMLAIFQSDYSAAECRLAEGLACARQLGDEARETEALSWLRLLSSFQVGDQPAATEAEAVLVLARKVGDRFHTSRTLDALAGTDAQRGEFSKAKARLQESLRISQEAGDSFSGAMTLNDLGDLARQTGDYGKAETFYRKSLASLRALSLKDLYPGLIHNLAYLAHYRGNAQQAADLFEQSLTNFRANGDRRGMAECLAGLSSVALGEGMPERTAVLLGAAATLLESIGAVASGTNRHDRESAEAAARGQLGDEGFAAAWTAGRMLPIQDAIDLAMERPQRSVVHAAAIGSDVKSSNQHLTPREHEVAVQLVSGLSNREIAYKLVISERTTANHVAHILDKLGVQSRTQLTARAREFGL